MEPYTEKFAAMQQYLPFLERMIGKLERAGDRARQPELAKMKSLHRILTDSSRKVPPETLVKCEQVLRALHEKVEGGPLRAEGGRDHSDSPASPNPQQQDRGPGPGLVRRFGRGPGLLGEPPPGPPQRGPPPGQSGPPHQHRGPPPGPPHQHRGLPPGRPDPWETGPGPGGPGWNRPPPSQHVPPPGQGWHGHQRHQQPQHGPPDRWGGGGPAGPDRGGFHGPNRGGHPGPDRGGFHSRPERRQPGDHGGGGVRGGRPGPERSRGRGFHRGGANLSQAGWAEPPWQQEQRGPATPRGPLEPRGQMEPRVPAELAGLNETRGRGRSEERGGSLGFGGEEAFTPASPDREDTPHSPPPLADRPLRAIPLETKSIPLERDESHHGRSFGFVAPGQGSQESRPKLSEEERKKKLLKLKQKLDGKAGSFPQDLLVSSAVSEEERGPEPDNPASRPAWLSPPGPDSPPTLSIAESPVSPDTQTASPDTQSAAPPDTPASPAPASPDPPASPDLVILDPPASPSPVERPTRQIPTEPVLADSTQSSQPSQPSGRPVEKPQQRRRDPRSRGRSPPRPLTALPRPLTAPPLALTVPPKPSPYDPSIARTDLAATQVVPDSRPPAPSRDPRAVPASVPAPAYMSNILPSAVAVPPPPVLPPCLPPPGLRPQLQRPALLRPPPSAPYQAHPPRAPPPRHQLRMPGQRPQGPIMVEPHFQPAPKPRNYREYRMLKDKIEKEKKEAAEKAKEAELAQKETELKASQPEKTNVTEVDNFSEERPKDAFAEKKAIERNRESKDPRKNKLLANESTKKRMADSDEGIKSFKIPKVKKVETGTTSHENQGKKALKEVDMFLSIESSAESKKSKTKVTEKFITEQINNDSVTKKKGRINKKKTEFLSEDEDTDSKNKNNDEFKSESSNDTKSIEQVENLTKSKVYDSDSDSEPSLTIAIAEDSDEKRLPFSESDLSTKSGTTAEEFPDVRCDNESDSKTDIKDEETFSKNELTRELLKNLVSNLNAKDVTKLLEKASSMKKDEKISLTSLTKSLIEVKSDDSDDDLPLSVIKNLDKSKTKSNIKPKRASKITERVAQAQGTRKSKRIQQEDVSESIDKNEDLDIEQDVMEDLQIVSVETDAMEEQAETEGPGESECETFVIEPKPTKRGRKKRGKKVVTYSELEEDLQDDSISSSNIVEQIQEAKQNEQVEPKMEVDQIKEEIEDKSQMLEIETEDSVEIPQIEFTDELTRRLSSEETRGSSNGSMRQTRSMRSKKLPKSKTWFPTGQAVREKREPTCLKSPPIKLEASVKKETVEVDTKAFLGEGEVASDQFREKVFSFSAGKVEDERKTLVKSRHSNISSILEKLKNNMVPNSDLTVKNKVENSKKLIKPPTLCSKIKLRKPSTGPSMDTLSLTQQINIKPLKDFDPLNCHIVDRLLCTTELKESVDQDEESLPSFLEIVQNMRKRDERRKLPPPALIPLQESGAMKKLVLGQLEPKHFTAQVEVENTDILQYKKQEIMEDMLSPDILRNFFKCMHFSCSFASDSASDFMLHVISHEDATARCCYCFGKVKNKEKLANHMIKHHGKKKYQCIHCFGRFTSQNYLLLHQNIHHRGLSKGFILCEHAVCQNPATTTRNPTNILVKCSASQCDFECESGKKSKMETHRRKHETSEALFGYFCHTCGFSCHNHVKMILHQARSHEDLKPSTNIKVVELGQESQDVIMSSDDGEESEDESDTESDLSDFDKHFYDDDIDTIEHILEKPDVGLVEQEDSGLCEEDLYKCANARCTFSSATPAALKTHLQSCKLSNSATSYNCYHCSKAHIHIAALMEHLKTHALKRISCSLCDFKSSTVMLVKNHSKVTHKMVNTRLLPVHNNKNNLEEDFFVLIPRNAFSKVTKSRYKDTFAPSDISLIPVKPDIYKHLIRCSLCDFATRVRNNLVKHLKLHNKMDKLVNLGSEEIHPIATVAPVNPPPVEETESSAMSRMTSLLPEDIDEDLYRKPISEADMTLMPRLVPENARYACSVSTCGYITVDEIMLLYHIQALHIDLAQYVCPHCTDTTIPLEETGLHLKCHGELLFKCGYCTYIHWQKRIAEKHVADEHPQRKQFVKNVREQEEKEPNKEEIKIPVETDESARKSKKKEVEGDGYDPYKCGVCDMSAETQQGIVSHCQEFHQMDKQFKCGLCSIQFDKKKDVETHFTEVHPGKNICVLKVYYVDPSTSHEFSGELKRPPLWAREMEGMKHIRGILYEDYEEQKKVSSSKKVKKSEIMPRPEESQTVAVQKLAQKPVTIKLTSEKRHPESEIQVKPTALNKKLVKNCDKSKLDNFPMNCQQCSFHKKTVTGLKMHIKLNHLGVGKFQCSHCVFSANLPVSIKGHYRKKHPEYVVEQDGQETFDYKETNSSAQNFNEEFWKENWGIPTIGDRKLLLHKSDTDSKTKRKTDDSSNDSPKRKRAKPGPKKGTKRKVVEIETLSSKVDKAPADSFEADILKAEEALGVIEEKTLAVTSAKPIIDQHQSPFESRKTYKCGHCPKRSQFEERIRRHSAAVHPDQKCQVEVLNRDQVVTIITSGQSRGTPESEYKCFYCQEIGDICRLLEHNRGQHSSQKFRVVKFQGKGVTGYLECQICGYLSPGFEKYFQKAHFHEEHLLEPDVICSKYISKAKTGLETFTGSQQAFKFDVNEVFGMTFQCPKRIDAEDCCSFSTQTLAQMNTHLRQKHTKTYKCGWCGQTFLDNSSFHQHSAMSHGDKIPDLVKDPEAEAEYEALKGLLEEDILSEISRKREEAGDVRVAGAARLVARKSTQSESRTKPGDKCRNVSRKSTGAAAKFWPETRIEIPYSFYQIPPQPYDAKQIKTRMAMGGVEITLDAEKMGELIKLDPQLVLTDCKAEGLLDQFN